MLNNSFKFNMEEFNNSIDKVNSYYNYKNESEYIYIKEDDDDDDDDDKKKKKKNGGKNGKNGKGKGKEKDLKNSLDNQVKKATDVIVGKKETSLARKVVPRVAIYGGAADAVFNNFGMARGAGTLIGKGVAAGAKVAGEVGGAVVTAPFKGAYYLLTSIGNGILGK